MSHLVWSVCLSLCWLLSCAKTAEPIEMSFGGHTGVGRINFLVLGCMESRSPTGRGTFEVDVCQPEVTYLRTTACTRLLWALNGRVCSPPRRVIDKARKINLNCHCAAAIGDRAFCQIIWTHCFMPRSHRTNWTAGLNSGFCPGQFSSVKPCSHRSSHLT